MGTEQTELGRGAPLRMTRSGRGPAAMCVVCVADTMYGCAMTPCA